MTFHIDLAGRKDLSGEIYRQLRRAIFEGRLRPGDALPSTRALARQLDVSRSTVTVAYDRLVSESLTTARVGAGAFVSDQAGSSTAPTRNPTSGALCPRAIWDDVTLPASFYQPATFDFRTGLPSVSLFPHRAWRRQVRRALDYGSRESGAYLEAGGYRPLREAIAWHIGTSRGVVASAEDVTVTNGAQQALDLVARTMLDPGDAIAVEDPGYGLPRRLFHSLGLNVVPVPVDEEGLAADCLGPDVKAVYVTPAHQYPMGVTMSAGRRRALLNWAERNNGLVIEDDYDGEFRLEGRPLSALKTSDACGRVVYVGSFSKVLLPSLRLGFVITAPRLTRPLQAAKYVCDWHTALLPQQALAAFIEEGDFARHVRKAGKAYLKRRQCVASILGRDFDGLLEMGPSRGGMHLTATGGAGFPADIAPVVSHARRNGVAFHPLSMFSDAPLTGLTIGFGAIELEQIEEGLALLRQAFSSTG